MLWLESGNNNYSANKNFFSFSMPGIIFPTNRNIYLTLFSRFASQAWQMVSDGSFWWTENIYSELHRPGLSSRIGDKPKFLGPFGYSYRLAIHFKKQGCFLCKKRTWTFTESKCLKMYCSLNLLELKLNWFGKKFRKISTIWLWPLFLPFRTTFCPVWHVEISILMLWTIFVPGLKRLLPQS